MSPVRILIFAKAPVPGRVKTRLIPALGPTGAARLASRLLRHTLSRHWQRPWDRWSCAPLPPDTPRMGWPAPSLGMSEDSETRDSCTLTAITAWTRRPAANLTLIAEPLPMTGGLAASRLETSDQGDGDLGARLARAAQRYLDLGGRVLMIGADCPSLSARHLREAAEALEDHEAALIPARDGGYVLLGLRTFDPSLFTDLPWSTSAVASLTLARIQALGWRVWIGDELVDIDEPADLGDLPDDLDQGGGLGMPSKPMALMPKRPCIWKQD